MMDYRLLFPSIFVIGLLLVCVFLVQNRVEIRELKKEIQIEDTGTEPELTLPEVPDPVVQPSKHKAAIAAMETEMGVPYSLLAALEMRNEGKRLRPYPDAHGNPTIAVGRNLRGNGISIEELNVLSNEIDRDLLLSEARIQKGRIYIDSLELANRVFVKPLTREDVEFLLVSDLRNTTHDAIEVFGEQIWQEISPARRLAILDILFNLGMPRFRKFVNFIESVRGKDWQKASIDLLLSQAARENIVRFYRAAVVTRTDNKRLFDLD